MSSSNPCHHDCTDFPDLTDGAEDKGCCSPYPIRKTCEGPTLPVPDCGEEAPVVTYDEDTEEFIVTTTMYDNNCSPLLDSTSSPLLSLIA